jgi:hypothetical protein
VTVFLHWQISSALSGIHENAFRYFIISRDDAAHAVSRAAYMASYFFFFSLPVSAGVVVW